MKKKAVRDIMIPLEKYPTIHKGATLAEAIKVLKDTFHPDDRGVVTGQRSILVINDEKELAGILTIRTMLNAINVNAKVSVSLARLFAREMVGDNAMMINVSEVMRPLLSHTVNVNASAADAVQVILTGKVNIIPVMDGDKPVGIVRSVDLFNILGELLS